MNAHELELLREVVALPTAPFHEKAVADRVRRWAREQGLRLRADAYGNLLATLQRGREGPHWVLVAHMDHPGFVATRQRGRTVWGRFFGGVAPRYFCGGRMRWLTEAGALGAEVVKVEDRELPLGFHPVRVHLEREGRVEPGTIGMWDLPPVRVRGRHVYSRACDDLAGLALAMGALGRFARSDRPGTLSLLATRGEEAGFVGALGAVQSGLLPRRAVVVSVECSSAAAGCVVMGGGVVIRVGDRSSVFDPGVSARLVGIAGELAREDEGFRFQRALMAGGTCEASAFAPFGYTVGAICLPLGNYHNQGRRGIAPESIHLDDVSAGLSLLAALPGHSPAQDPADLRARMEQIWTDRRQLLGEL